MDNSPAGIDVVLGQAVRSLAVAFARRNIRHAMIGGMALGIRSRPRATKDVDFILQVPALTFPGLLEELAADGFDIDVPATIRRWSSDRLIVFYRGEARVDWMQPVLPMYARVLDTAQPLAWQGTEINVATAEGLILTKMVAFRGQDKADIETLLAVNRDSIDLDFVFGEWAFLADAEPQRTAWLKDTAARIVKSRS